MKNQELAQIFNEIADLLEMKEVQFKPRAYRKAAQNIESLGEDVEDVYKRGELKKIPGIGKSIAEKIEEFLENGKVQKLEDLKEETPVDIENLTSVETLGPKKIKVLHQELQIKNLDDLEKAAKERKIRNLEGFGKKTEENILENISFAKKSKQRFLLGYVSPEAKEIKNALKKHVDKIEIAGSLRRKKETIGDVDILAVTSNAKDVMNFFTSLDKVKKVMAKGETKSSVRLYGGIQVDLRIVKEESFGSALQYFTGSKDHNIEIRKIAQKNNFKLNEYGLFKNDKQIAGETEEEIYETLGMNWVPPELRENNGEVDAANENNLPDLVEYSDVKGDLQMHSNWSDGSNTIEEMVEEAINLGHEFIAFTDHVGSLKVAGGMDIDELEKQAKKINQVRDRYDDIHIFHGVEANIMKDGKIDVSDDLLDIADVVLASIHSAFRMDEKEMTNRVINAISNDYVGIYSHPTGRKIQKKEPIKLDLEKVIDAAIDKDVALEINAYPERLDLNDAHVRQVVERGGKLSIGTDAHRKDHLRYYELGISVARRGWAEKDDIINTYSVDKLKKTFNKI
ncbi:MAG: DNA polymerase/3'-5' exonuclease PolX [Candidatus Thermoplasmatota archaeon]